eukprot:CAMPEP_0203662408 /NCGR_PEP_ID=MMETSP0090-20130426/384_1 /ASSEMBLY_ACC=CAM_ASM_001088 /TAXON_ID=426623 /ORGANISM="Chaetoceros affinis, Strain CCMP159" /LENGTH=117 /DNA_ID=CAMNT_0050525189 /DNA_START=71 /DNA_END=424 /DNA_ORIENTATION=+
MASALKEWNDNQVCVITCDGRLIQGKLVGYDQLQNLILQDAQERVYQLPPPQKGSDDDEDDDEVLEVVPLGLYIIRGDNVAIVSDVKDEVWASQEKNQFEEFTKDSEAVKAVVQFIN